MFVLNVASYPFVIWTQCCLFFLTLGMKPFGWVAWCLGGCIGRFLGSGIGCVLGCVLGCVIVKGELKSVLEELFA